MRRYMLVMVLCALLAVGLVCEQEFYEETFSLTTEPDVTTEFVVVIDKSGSMRGDRLDNAKIAAADFVEALTDTQRAAVIAFDERAQLVHEMSDDTQSLAQAISEIRVGFWTAYVPALMAAQEQFSADANKIIVFFSDGVDEEPERVFESLTGLFDDDICIYTIAYAADPGTDVLLGGMAQQSFAETGCGNFFEARENGFDLEYIFQTLHRDHSAQRLLNVHTELTSSTARVSATHNGQSLYADACFAPTATLTVWDDEGIVFREHTPTNELAFALPSGEYRYETTVSERCGGHCYVFGVDEGEFSVEPASACTFTEQDYFLLATPDIVRITKEGFSPRTLGTAGVVIWSNQDDKPRKVLGVQGAWESPLILPGENWSRTFSEGVHGYTDEEGSFSGTIRTTRTTEPSQFVFVFDNSGSMAGQPLQAAKEAAIAFVELLSPRDRASVIVFDQRVRLLQDATTTDKTRLISSIESIRAEGFSLYIPAIALAGSQLNQPIARKPVVIFLSDGLPRDPQGIDGILEAMDEHFDGVCLHVIAYLSDDPKARELLTTMANHAYSKTRCGALYTVVGAGEELRAVLGEIYVAQQEPLLEFTDTEVRRTSKGAHISTRLRSTQTGLEIPTTEYACLPPATVRAIIGITEYPMTYNGTHYVATIEDVGYTTRSVDLAARLTVQGSARTATAQSSLQLPVKIPWGWLVVSGVGIFLLWFSRRKTL